MGFYTSAFVRRGKNGKGWRKCLKYQDGDSWKVISTMTSAAGKRAAQKEAEEWRLEMNAKKEAELAPKKPKRKEAAELTVGEYAKAYLASREVDGTIGPSTILDYRKTMKDIVCPASNIAGIEMGELEPQDIRNWFTWLRSDERGLSVTSVRKRHTLLKMILAQAVVDEVISHNPMEGIRRPKAIDRKKPNALTPDSVARVNKWLESAPPTSFTSAVAMALFIGMRRQECAAIKWEDIDFDGGVMEVHRAIGNGDGGEYIKDPKNHEARFVPIPDTLRRVLMERRDKVEKEIDSPIFDGSISELYVCGECDGSYGSMWGITRRWGTLRELLELEGVSRKEVVFHDLRHTFATYTIHAGMDIVTVSKILGHKSVKMTLDVYAAALPNAIRNAAPDIARALSVGNTENPQYLVPEDF